MCLARRLETFTPDWNWQLAVRNSKPSVVFLHSSWQLQNAALKEGSQERNLPALVSSDLLSFRASSVQSKTCCRRVCKRRCISKCFLYRFFFRIVRIFCCEHQCSWFVIRCSTIGSVAPTSKLVSHKFQSEKDIFSNLQRSSATAKSASYPFGPPHTAMAQAPPGWPNSLELPSSRRNMDKHLRRHDTSWYVESSYVRFEKVWKFNMSLLSGAFGVLHLPCDTDRPAQIAQIVQLLELRRCFSVRLTNQKRERNSQVQSNPTFIADILAAAVLCTQYQRLD